ncbi:SET domain-containing protein [Ceratobasidium sp. AG-I]|nr:SET domain-containing protein [Ceratobasidium sp. AG-I]
MSQRVRTLLDWCELHGITLSDIEIVDHGPDHLSFDQSGICVFASGDLSYSDSGLAKIPKSIVLSKRTSQLLTKLPGAGIAGDEIMELALVLTYETALSKQSKWFGYLQSLPFEQVPVAALWEDNTDEDSQFAFQWLQGTETSRVINPTGKPTATSHNVVDYYYRIASPLLTRMHLAPTLSDFQRAWSLVSSRSFRVDSYHGLAMVPIADAFNHTGENQVHIETDFDVCSTCGSLQSCPHDEDDEAQNLGPRIQPLVPFEDTCDMVMNAPVKSGDEVFNSYDANLPNSVLLARYGFILEGNDNDYISWDVNDLPRTLQHCAAAFSDSLVWTRELLAETSLVYDPGDTSATAAVTPITELMALNRSACRTPQYKVNADGLVSVDLWVLAAIGSMKPADDNFLDTISQSRLQRLARAQVYAESREHDNHRIEDSGMLAELSLELKHIATLIQELCRSRLLEMYRPELSAVECGNLLDVGFFFLDKGWSFSLMSSGTFRNFLSLCADRA